MFLKKSTAVDIVVGPFVDEEDGATLKTGLTIAQADVQLSKNAGSFAQKNSATSATHLKDGQYKVPLSTTDTNTNGYLRVSIVMSGCLPVWAEYLIVPANVYDSLVGGSASLDVSATSVRSAVGLGSANLDTQLSGINSKTTNLPGSPAAVGSAMTLSDGAITAAKIASNAITDAKIANNAITGDKVSTTAVTKIQSGLATSSALTTVGGNVSAIPTNPLLTNDVRLGNLDAKVSDVKTQTDKIPASPAAVGSKMKLDNDAIDASVIKADAVTKIQSGLATPTNITSGTITNLTNLPSAPADWLTASAVKADAVTKIQSGLATSTNVSTVGSKVDGLNDITAKQVWEYNDRELSTPANYKADVTGIPAAVWGYATRTLSSFGSLISDIWSHATRTLSAFGFTVVTNKDADITAIRGKTDSLPANTATAISAIPTNPLLTNDARLDHLDADISSVGGGGGGATAQEVWEYASRGLSTPSDYKADVSGLATAAALSTVGGKVDAIKTKTDNLPANTATAIGAIPTNPLLTNDARLNNLDAKISDRPTNPFLTNDARLNNLDAKISDVKAKTDKIPNQPAPAGEYDTQLDATISSRLAESSYTAPDNAGIGQIQTDIGNLSDIEVDDILDAEVEGAYTLKEVLRIMVSALAGKADGGGTGTITFRDLSDAVDRIEATVDGVGNRTDVTLDVGD